jgi:hypothetical protein
MEILLTSPFLEKIPGSGILNLALPPSIVFWISTLSNLDGINIDVMYGKWSQHIIHLYSAWCECLEHESLHVLFMT